MWFVIALVVLIAVFLIGFKLVKSGRLTYYMLAIDAALINMQSVFEQIAGFNFETLMSAAQQGWLVLTATVLAALARARSKLRDF